MQPDRYRKGVGILPRGIGQSRHGKAIGSLDSPGRPDHRNHNRIVQQGSEGPYLDVFPGRMYAVCQENYDDGLLQVNPKGGAGKAKVPNGMGRKVTPATGPGLRGGIESEGTFAVRLPGEETP